jgi:hypothetical protein
MGRIHRQGIIIGTRVSAHIGNPVILPAIGHTQGGIIRIKIIAQFRPINPVIIANDAATYSRPLGAVLDPG